MVAVTIMNLIVMLLLYSGFRLKIKGNLMPGVVMILIVFYSIRYGFGNDFKSYEHMFYMINGMTLDRAMGHFERLEDGWIILNYLFKGLDFQVFLVFLTTIQFCSIGWFISRYVEPKYQWAIMGIYMFLPSMMLIQLSMLRQGLAIQIVMMSVYFIIDKRKYWWIGLLLVYLAVQFHKSAYFAFALFLFPLMEKFNYRVLIAIYIGLFGVFQFMPDFMNGLMNSVLDIDEFERYDVYMGKGNYAVEMRSGLGFAFQMMVGLYLMYITRWKSTKNRFFIISMGIFYTTLPLTGLMGLVSRVSYYFFQVGLPSYGEIFRRARKDPLALLIGSLLIFYIFQSYMKFFYDPVWTKRYMHYTTIFNNI